jgi:hypothetical protein
MCRVARTGKQFSNDCVEIARRPTLFYVVSLYTLLAFLASGNIVDGAFGRDQALAFWGLLFVLVLLMRAADPVPRQLVLLLRGWGLRRQRNQVRRHWRVFGRVLRG